MRALDREQKRFLEEKFRGRISFDRTERKLYGHDIAAMPLMMKPIIGDTTPDAVVQPENETELVELIRWAGKRGIPLTPRGKASSGYGGVLPVDGGIVVDFYRMNRIIDINRESMTATVQAGVVWEKLDRALKAEGMTLRLYPSSYPGSTVGGWLAQGGAGIGSFEAGWFKDNVVSARVVPADGSVRVLAGKDLNLVSEAEGITGFISEITIRIKKDEKISVVAVGAADAGSLQKFLQSVIDARLPIWSIIFINPQMALLRNRAPEAGHRGAADHPRPQLPPLYITTLSFRHTDRKAVQGRLGELVKETGCVLLSDEIASHEWENRFRLMVVKRLGPSLVPTEIVVPLAGFAEVMSEIDRKVRQPLVKEGIVVREGRDGRPEVVILGFIPSDQRKLSYNVIFALAMTVMSIARRHGGRPYCTGLYFAAKASQVLAPEALAAIRAFKAKTDPNDILNPKKVVANGLVGGVMRIAGALEPLARPLANMLATKVGERAVRPVKGIPADVVWYAYSCSQCGYCVEECNQFYGRGWESQSPRGKWYWLREYMEGRESWSQPMVDTVLSCTTCELCDYRCSEGLPIESSWMKLRGRLVADEKRMTFPPFEMMAAAMVKEGDVWAGYRTDRSAWFPRDLEEKHGTGKKSNVVYFAGCTVSYVEKDIGIAAVRLLDKASVDFAYLGQRENCCGASMLAAGKWDVFEKNMKDTIALMRAEGVDTVITSCPSCDLMWRHVYPRWAERLGIEFDIVAKHYTEAIAERIAEGTFVIPDNGKGPEVVTWHDSCHVGRASGIYDAPRALITANPNARFVEMEYIREEGRCCGGALTLVKEPNVAARIAGMRLEEAAATGASKVLTLCPGCQFQFRATTGGGKESVEVVDLARYTAEAFGFTFPDPNPEIQRLWAMFEGMVGLMTPQGLADLIATMWPELIGAVPFGMGSMMRVLGKIPGALEIMKPAFPIVFPVMLPVMLPKVMPHMLRKLEERIALPDYIREQMPEMMPKIMDNLMPHLMGAVIPLVIPSMLAYLRGEKQ